jgi:hypothetical protein
MDLGITTPRYNASGCYDDSRHYQASSAPAHLPGTSYYAHGHHDDRNSNTRKAEKADEHQPSLYAGYHPNSQAMYRAIVEYKSPPARAPATGVFHRPPSPQDASVSEHQPRSGPHINIACVPENPSFAIPSQLFAQCHGCNWKWENDRKYCMFGDENHNLTLRPPVYQSLK